MIYPMTFIPIYKEIIWGGRNLEKLGRELPEGMKVAESWDLSVRNGDMSIIANGVYKGRTLAEVLSEDRINILGKSVAERYKEGFPLFVKLIDANDDLSIQVHPDDRYAYENENGDSGKDETWVVLSAKKGAKLVCGLKNGINREVFKKALYEDRVEGLLNYINVEAGDVINIYPGLVHGIGSGIVTAEIQQNSNITYRVYDHGRKDKNGKARELHIDKALDVIEFNKKYPFDKIPGIMTGSEDGNSVMTYVRKDKYTLQKIDVNGEYVHFADGLCFYIYIVTEGFGYIEYTNKEQELKKASAYLIPASLGEYRIKGKISMIRAFVEDDFIKKDQEGMVAW